VRRGVPVPAADVWRRPARAGCSGCPRWRAGAVGGGLMVGLLVLRVANPTLTACTGPPGPLSLYSNRRVLVVGGALWFAAPGW